MTVPLTIGELSKMTYLSVKALRHYHEVGLLEPAEVDPSSGYRRYTADQVAIGQAIRRFRDLDMPLEQVRAVLQAPDLASRNEAILAHLEAMQAQLERTQHTVASLQALLERRRPPRPVTYRTLPATAGARRARRRWRSPRPAPGSRTASPSCTPPWTRRGSPRPGPTAPSTTTPSSPGGRRGGGVRAGGRRPAALDPRRAVDVALDLPATRVAAMVHDGPFDDLDQTYGALGTVVAELGLGADGPIREIYLADDRAEVCWPITQGGAR